MKKVPIAVQSLLCANSHLNTFISAVEELVYNSLDADSNSIAIRIDVSKGFMQVIDNGNGITKADLHVVGQQYMTSKFIDNFTLKPALNKYGFQGQSLANIIKVSKVFKIISRCDNHDETWIKTYYKGKQQEISHTTKRPSKGTTVEIKSFLYNLYIPKKANDSVIQIDLIKSFLEQISCAYTNVSISLRDDSRNEIIYKINKKRDIYQTLTDIFEIKKCDLQELKIEKSQYKAIAYICKNVKNSKHWIILNGKFLNTSKIHKIINDCFIKSFVNYKQSTKNNKVKNTINNEADQISLNKIPFYLVFITCPYDDYENIGNASKQSIVEFRNWNPLTKLLEKLVKFYFGDLNLKVADTNLTNNEKKYTENTRDKVKKIMEKILKPSKRFGVSQMQNGIKGKLVKRKKKKKLNNSLAKVLSPKNKGMLIVDEPNLLKSSNYGTDKGYKKHDQFKVNGNKKPRLVLSGISPLNCAQLQTDNAPKSPDIEEISLDKVHNNASVLIDSYKKNKSVFKSNINYHCKNSINELGTSTDISKNKHEILVERVQHQMNAVELNDNIYNNDFNSYTKNIPIDEKTEVSWNYLPRTTHQYQPNAFNQLVPYTRDVQAVRTCDLLHTVLNNQTDYNNSNEIMSPDHDVLTKDTIIDYIPTHKSCKNYKFSNVMATYDSHKDYFNGLNDCKKYNEEHKKLHYITNQSRKNFYYTNSNKYRKKQIKAFNFKPEKNIRRKSLFSHLLNTTSNNLWTENSKYTIEFTKTIESNFIVTSDRNDFNPNISLFESPIEPKTVSKYILNDKNPKNVYSEINDNKIQESNYMQSKKKFTHYNFNCHRNYKINESIISNNFINNNYEYNYQIEDKIEKQMNYVFLSKSQDSNDNLILNNDIEPIEVCETVLCSNILDDEEIPDIENTHNEVLNNSTESIQSPAAICKSICGNEYNLNKSLETSQGNSIFGRNENKDTNSNISANAINVIKTNEYNFNKSLETSQGNLIFERNENKDTNPNILANAIDGIKTNEYNLNKSLETSQGNSIFRRNENKDTNPNILANAINVITTNKYNLNKSLETSQGNSIFGRNENKDTNPNILANAINVITTNKYNLNKSLETSQGNSIFKRNENIDTNSNILSNVLNVSKTTNAYNEDLISDKGCPRVLRIDNSQAEDETLIEKFDFNNRLRFVPKGMSPIFKNCNTKNACNYNLEKDYYEDKIYNNFAYNVEVNAEIFEPDIQQMNEFTTNDIEKFKNKLKKINASLVFNDESLKNAKIIGQVDFKFIAALVKGQCTNTEEVKEYLVLFDQHAVHERIRLEQNLSDYQIDGTWKTAALDGVVLKLSKSDIIYLHNYKDKFVQLGMEWTFLSDSEICVNSIPKAIIGKHERPVEVVIDAMNNIITEEIDILKTQGCISLCPKSIMDLVSSEACRYAIKFGDGLSLNDCMGLIKKLSNCKTPFQCAHGRPVMAVLMKIEPPCNEYEIDISKLKNIKKKIT